MLDRFFPSAHRPQLLDGCDRVLYIAAATVSALIPYIWKTWWSLMIAFAWYFAARAILRRLGKSDPLAVPVFLRRMGWRAFYPARSTYRSRPRRVAREWLR